MSLKSAPYYWLVCDAPECEVTSAENAEYAAWAGACQAEDSAGDSDWNITDTGSHYCPDHYWYACEKCGQPAGDLSGERDYMCQTCFDKEEVSA